MCPVIVIVVSSASLAPTRFVRTIKTATMMIEHVFITRFFRSSFREELLRAQLDFRIAPGGDPSVASISPISCVQCVESQDMIERLVSDRWQCVKHRILESNAVCRLDSGTSACTG